MLEPSDALKLQNPMAEPIFSSDAEALIAPPIISSDPDIQKISYKINPIYPSDCEVLKNKIPKMKKVISTKSLGKKIKGMLD